MKKIVYYVVPVLLCLIAGLVAGRLQAESVAVWYPLLAKPALTPPDIAFPIAWGIIYLCMGLSLGRVLRYGDKRYVTLWFLQLAVNFLWSVFFFYLRSPLAGFVDILLLDALVIVYICRVRHRTPSAAWLFAPYVLWILFATYLNGYILVKNPDNKIVTQNVLTTNIDTLSNSKNRQTMKHTLPQLPYKTEALAPKMSAETFEYHYGKHLQTYIDNLNKLIEGTPYAEMPLDEIVRKADGGVFNNAAQTWNHTFFFLTLTPDQQPMPEKLAAALARVPGSHAAGFFYCRIADPTVQTESRIREEVERQIAKKLALSGISLSDVTILRAQGGQQAAMVTKDGKPNGRFAASMVDEAGMEKLLTFARNKAAALADEIYAGEIDDSPVERETFNACQNCEYSAICVFDPLRKPRRRLTAKRLEDLT